MNRQRSTESPDTIEVVPTTVALILLAALSFVATAMLIFYTFKPASRFQVG